MAAQGPSSVRAEAFLRSAFSFEKAFSMGSSMARSNRKFRSTAGEPPLFHCFGFDDSLRTFLKFAKLPIDGLEFFACRDPLLVFFWRIEAKPILT